MHITISHTVYPGCPYVDRHLDRAPPCGGPEFRTHLLHVKKYFIIMPLHFECGHVQRVSKNINYCNNARGRREVTGGHGRRGYNNTSCSSAHVLIYLTRQHV